MKKSEQLTESDLQMAVVGYRAEIGKLEAAIADIEARIGKDHRSGPVDSAPKKRRLSPAARKRIGVAQKKRWAAYNKAKAEAAKPKRKLSAAGRKAISEASKKRWAAQRRAAKKVAA